MDNGTLLCPKNNNEKRHVEPRKVRERSRFFELHVLIFSEERQSATFSKSLCLELINKLKIKLKEERDVTTQSSIQKAIDDINDLNGSEKNNNKEISDGKIMITMKKKKMTNTKTKRKKEVTRY